jgi:hypothetical protein
VADKALDEKMAAVDKILDEFEWHCQRVREIAGQASEELGSFGQLVKQHGKEGAEAFLALTQRLYRIQTASQNTQKEVTSNVGSRVGKNLA